MRIIQRVSSPPFSLTRCRGRGAIGALLGIGLIAVGLIAYSAPAGAGVCITPTIDGSLGDMIDFANCIPVREGCGLVKADAEKDVCRIDQKFEGCVAFQTCPATGTPDYLPNGADIVTAVAAFQKSSGITYLGMRVRSGQVVGDADAGGTCDDDCVSGNIPDANGIGLNEPYSWFIDTDCDGIQDIDVTVKNNQVFVNDVLSGTASMDFECNGSDLEVSVPGLNLPPKWQFRAFIGFTFDGVAEDLTGFATCPTPEAIIDVACSGPAVVCAGTTADYTVTVTNTGEADLTSVSGTVTLPAGLNFVSILDDDNWDSSGEAAGVITCLESSLPIGAVRTVQFRVAAKSECSGSVPIASHAEGTFSQTGCVEAVVVSDDQNCDVRCSQSFCDINGDDTICAGGTTQFCFNDLLLGGFTFAWTGPGGFTASTSCTGPISVAGQYGLTVTNPDGCVASCNRTLTVNPLPVCNITGDNVICGGQKDTNFCGPGGLAAYSWTGPGGFTASTQCTGTISVAGVYNLTITDSNGCQNTCNRELFVDQPPSCVITGCDELISGGDPTEFCGPGGLASYEWTGPGGFTASTQCTGPISEPGQYNLTVEDENGCSCSNSRTLTESTTTCTISGDNEICEGDQTQFCGPGGMASYSWTGPGGFTASTQCITVGVEGLYLLDIANQAGCEASCDITLVTEPCGGACPRTPGFWKQQCLCAQGEGGRVKFSCAEMDLITGCIDNTSSFFNWGTADRANFCAALDPPTPMRQRQQAKRQYAAFLANVCVGQLAILANNGDIVNLPLNTPITGACSGLANATTVGDLIPEVDALLTSLEGQSLDDQAVKDAYGEIITCLDRINNGVGIPFDPEACVPPNGDVAAAFADRGLLGNSQTDVSPTLEGVDLFKPTPNPFKQSTRMAYAVSGSAGAQVEISVYNTAGRKVRTLVSGVVAPGRHEAVWNGRDDKGAAVPAGVYFYRSVIGGESTVTRVTYMR